MDPFTKTFDEVVHKALERWHIPGSAFSVVQGDQSWSKAYGIAQVPHTPVTPSTLFYAASTTKAHLCAVWAKYIASDENQQSPIPIKWSTPLADLIRDDFVLEGLNNTSAVTIEDAVSHRTGMPRHELCYGHQDVLDHEEVTRVLRHLPLHNTLRSHYEYCNIMFAAASHALETVTGRPILEILREDLWKPLSMNSTCSDAEARGNDGKGGAVFAKCYTWSKSPIDPDFEHGELSEEPPIDLTPVSGAGFVVSTAEDYARWMRCWLNKSNPLDSELIKELWTPRTIIPQEESEEPYEGVTTYCLGWFKAMYRGEEVIWHSGGVNSGGGLVILLPDKQWGVTFFANGLAPSVTLKSTAFYLIDELLSTPEEERKYPEMDQEVFDYYKKFEEKYLSARSSLYPTASADSVPPFLPAESYAGTFSHPAYGPIHLTVSITRGGEEVLSAHIERVFSRYIELRHVNSNWWIGTTWSSHSSPKSCFRAQSCLGAKGDVEAWKMALEMAMPDTMMRFDRQLA